MKPRPCERCHRDEAIWAYQPELGSFYTLGAHQRGFAVVRVCDACRYAISIVVAPDCLPAPELLDALRDIQFDLINCHEAAGRNACEHIKDAIKIVNRALAAAPARPAEGEE